MPRHEYSVDAALRRGLESIVACFFCLKSPNFIINISFIILSQNRAVLLIALLNRAGWFMNPAREHPQACPVG